VVAANLIEQRGERDLIKGEQLKIGSENTADLDLMDLGMAVDFWVNFM
jgi:hypothetical protein